MKKNVKAVRGVTGQNLEANFVKISLCVTVYAPSEQPVSLEAFALTAAPPIRHSPLWKATSSGGNRESSTLCQANRKST
jgi:hypothetical protein